MFLEIYICDQQQQFINRWMYSSAIGTIIYFTSLLISISYLFYNLHINNVTGIEFLLIFITSILFFPALVLMHEFSHFIAGKILGYHSTIRIVKNCTFQICTDFSLSKIKAKHHSIILITPFLLISFLLITFSRFENISLHIILLMIFNIYISGCDLAMLNVHHKNKFRGEVIYRKNFIQFKNYRIDN